MKSVIGMLGVAGVIALRASSASAAWAAIDDIDATFNSPLERTGLASCKLDDDRMLVAGGLDSSGDPTDTSVIYDKVADEWLPTFDQNQDQTFLPAERAYGKMLAFQVEGISRCWYVSGQGKSGGSITVEDEIFEYDDATGEWTQLGFTIPSARYGFEIAQLSSSKFVVIGGSAQLTAPQSATSPLSTDTLILLTVTPGSQAADEIQNVPPTPVDQDLVKPRFNAQVVTVPLGGGNVDFYVMGGRDASAVTNDVERITLNSSGQLTARPATDDLNQARERFVAFPVSFITDVDPSGVTDNRSISIMAVGGSSGTAVTSNAELLDASAASGVGEWFNGITAFNLTTARADLQQCTDSNGDVVVVSGYTESSGAPNNTVAKSQAFSGSAWNGEQSMVTSGNPATGGRADQFALECLGTDVVAAGGTKFVSGAGTVLSSAERF